jgi:hypothetical protein
VTAHAKVSDNERRTDTIKLKDASSEEISMSEHAQAGSPERRAHPWRGAHLFAENRRKFPPEELLKYFGKYVAWSPDGSSIFDSDCDHDALWERIKASRDEPGLYCIEYITDETYI